MMLNVRRSCGLQSTTSGLTRNPEDVATRIACFSSDSWRFIGTEQHVLHWRGVAMCHHQISVCLLPPFYIEVIHYYNNGIAAAKSVSKDVCEKKREKLSRKM